MDNIDKEFVRKEALAALKRQRERVERGETPDLTLDEINEEIRKARQERCERDRE